MSDNWRNTEPPYFSGVRPFTFTPTPRGLRLVAAQLSISSIISTIISSIIMYMIPLLLGWLFGLTKIPEDAPILSPLLWVLQHPLVLVILGIVILCPTLFWLQTRYSLMTNFMHRLTRTYWRFLVPVAIAAIIGVGAFYLWPHLPQQPLTAHANTSDIRYTAQKPGLVCNPNDKRWSHRTSAATEKCTAQGLDMVVEPGWYLGEVGFDPRTLSGAGNLKTYCVQMTAMFVDGDANAAIIIGVHGQTPGGQVIEFFQNGDLTILHFQSDRTPTDGPALASGSFPATSPLRLAVGVDGSHVTVWVNEQRVLSADDSTYTRTDYVLLGLKTDPSAPAEAVFSDFVFQAGTLSGCGS